MSVGRSSLGFFYIYYSVYCILLFQDNKEMNFFLHLKAQESIGVIHLSEKTDMVILKLI